LRPSRPPFPDPATGFWQSLLHVVDLRIRDRDVNGGRGPGRRRRCGHCLLLLSFEAQRNSPLHTSVRLLHCTLVCNNGVVPTESSRVRSMNETRDRILDVALDVLGENPDAGMGDIASACRRRPPHGLRHFPSRLDLVRTLTERAVTEMTAVLAEASASDAAADATWAGFVARVWPVAHRYRVLLALRRGEYGEAIHGLLGQSMSSSPTS